MYVILASRKGEYRSELVDGLVPVEVYDYMFYGRNKARFTIALLEQPVKIRIVDEGPPQRESFVSSKFLDHYDTLENAREALQELVSFGSIDIRLECRPISVLSELSQEQA